MPQQLIYTSAPRGLAAGRAGFCTVAMSAGLREALALKLEQISYFDHGAMGAGEQVIRAFRLIDLRGTRYFVLSRVQDCGLDFTQRTNFIAHHLIFTPEEVSDVATPPEIFRQWSGWLDRWDGEPRVFSDNDWGNLYAIPSRQPPARAWARLAGDAMNAFALLETTGLVLNVEGVADDAVLDLFAESLALLEAREARDFRAAAWQLTFTTALQNQDAPADFRWRCVRGDGGGLTNLGSARVLPLLQLRPARVSVGEASFARSGYQPPKILAEPKDAYACEGESVTLRVEVSGVPAPNRFQWFSLSRTGAEEPLADASGPELSIRPARGMNRYCVKISNLRGDTVMSRVAQVSVDAAVRVPTFQTSRSQPASRVAAQTAQTQTEYVADPLEVQTFKLNAQRRERQRLRNRMLVVVAMVLIAAAGAVFLVSKKPQWFSNVRGSKTAGIQTTNADLTKSTKAGETNLGTASATLPPARGEIADEGPLIVMSLENTHGKLGLNDKRAARFLHLFDAKTSGGQFSTVELLQAGIMKAESKPIAFKQPSNAVSVVCAWDKGQLTLDTNKEIKLTVTNLIAPRLFRFTSTNGNQAFKLLLWSAPAVTSATLSDGALSLPASITNGLTEVGLLSELRMELHYLDHKINVDDISSVHDVRSLFRPFLNKQAEKLEALRKQRAAITNLLNFIQAVRVPPNSVKSDGNLWAQVEEVCQFAAYEKNFREATFRFEGKSGAEIPRVEAAAHARREITQSRHDFNDLALIALDEQNIRILETLDVNGNNVPRAADARAKIEKEMDALQKELSVDARLKVSFTLTKHTDKPLIQLTITNK